MTRRHLVVLLMILGSVVGGISAYQTFSHVQDPSYRVPNLAVEEGSTRFLTETHSNYHAFRECLLTLGVLGILLWMALAKTFQHNYHTWLIGIILTGVYTLGWWLPWPLFGLRAPGLDAETAHLFATLLLTSGVILQKPLRKGHGV